jgi:hypothetical protein
MLLRLCVAAQYTNAYPVTLAEASFYVQLSSLTPQWNWSSNLKTVAN